MKGSPNYVMQVAENARRAVEDAISAENLACYLDGLNGTRDEAAARKETAMDLIHELERLARG